MGKIKNDICGIYKITSPSGRIYIGQSIGCLNRKRTYRNGCKKQAKLHSSIIKYGWNNHIFEIIHVCEERELNELEIYYSKLFNSRDIDLGLNIRECGGSRDRHSEESIIKCRLAKKGKKHTAEHIANSIMARNKLKEEGFVVWNKGLKGVQKDSEETRKKKRQSMLGKNRSSSHKENCKLRWIREKSSPDWDSIEAKKKRSEKHGICGQSHHSSRLVLNIENGIYYYSVKEASYTHNINECVLSRSLKKDSLKKHTSLIYA